MKVGSLFSGIGGIELGFEQAGFETEWFVECEPYAQTILRKHFPNTTIYDDVTNLDFKTIPQVDILTGGFPCQDISNAGKRVGIEGSRSSLWKYYFEAIRTIRPRIAFIENVSALLNRGLDVVLADLAEIGYDAEWYCVPASAVGANHQRDRIFIIAYPHIQRWNNRGNNRKERQVQDDKEWNSEKNKSERHRWGHRTWKISPDVAHPENNGFNGRRSGKNFSNKDRQFLYNKEGDRRKIQCKTEGCLCDNDKGIWSVEPDVGRVAHGISQRVDRIKCLGNAVVPQVAEVFARAIQEYEDQITTRQ